MALKDWSTSAASNGTADAGINWQEGQAPSTVNGSAREMMAVLKKALGHIVSVKDYGAVGDGVTDDTTAIQNAINALTNGGVVDFPPGVYTLADQIDIPYRIPIILRGIGFPNQATGAATGTELRSTLRDGSSPAINCVQAAADFALFGMEDLYLSGGTYTEVTGGPGQGGAALGNFVGLSIKNKLRWHLRNVRIAGFDTDGLRIDTQSYYGAAWNCYFMWNGCGVNSVDGGNVEGFFNCHFQYNATGSKNLRNTFGCAWEGNWNSGAKYNVAGTYAKLYSPYFESNNGADASGNQADIYCDTTNFPSGLSVYDPHFISGDEYSANTNATHFFYGKCTSLTVFGAMQIQKASPQLHPLFNLVGATKFITYTGIQVDYANFVNIGAGAIYINNGYQYLDVTLSSSTLTHFGNSIIRTTAGGATNLDNIQSGYYGQRLTLIFGDNNITVRSTGGGSGNIRLSAATFAGTTNDTLNLIYDPNGDLWKQTSSSVN